MTVSRRRLEPGRFLHLLRPRLTSDRSRPSLLAEALPALQDATSVRSPRIRVADCPRATAYFPPDGGSACGGTVSPEPWAVPCCAHSAGSGHPELSRGVLAYPETRPCMAFLFVGSRICTSAVARRAMADRPASRRPGVALAKTSFPRHLAATPLPSASPSATLQQPGLRTGDFSASADRPRPTPHKYQRPCRAYTSRC